MGVWCNSLVRMNSYGRLLLLLLHDIILYDVDRKRDAREINWFELNGWAILGCFQVTMRFPLIGQNRSIFIGNLRLCWVYFYRLMRRNA